MAEGPNPSKPEAILELRPLATGELIDRGFQLFRRHFIPILYFSALVQALPFALGLIASHFNRFTNPLEYLNHPRLAIFNAAILGIEFVLLTLGSGALTYYISQLYLGNNVPIHTALRTLAPQAARLLYTAILRLLIIVATLALAVLPWLIAQAIGEAMTLPLATGLLLLAVVLCFPCVIVITHYLVMVPVVVLENKGGYAALRRSSELVRYNPGPGYMQRGEMRLSLLLLIVLAVQLLVFMIGAAPSVLVTAQEFLRGNLNPGPAQLSPLLTTVKYLVNFFGDSLVAPLYLIAETLFYYDIRVRKEGLDLELMAGALQPGGNAPTSSPQT